MSPARPTLAPQLRTALAPVVERCGLLLEDVSVAPGGRRTVVRAVVDLPDGPGGVSSDALTEVSRDISARLDEIDLVPGTYTLEVSTPGTGRPLTQPRHFRRAVGRLVVLETVDGPRAGRLVAADDAGVTLDVDGTTVEVAHDRLEHARIEVELARPSTDDAQA